MKSNNFNNTKTDDNNSFSGITKMVHDNNGSYLVQCDRAPYHIDDMYPMMDELDENGSF